MERYKDDIKKEVGNKMIEDALILFLYVIEIRVNRRKEVYSF